MAAPAQPQQKKTLLMTEGSIWKSILLFSVPLILGNLLQQLYNTADSITEQGYRYVFRCNIKGSQEAGYKTDFLNWLLNTAA